ncbi:MAG: hypothetical protein ABSE77_12915 [Acidimicrobiales bacterium]
MLAPAPKTAATPEAGAGLAAPTTPTEAAPAYSATADGPSSVPPLTDLPGALAASGTAPRHQGTPDLGIFSPLAGTVPAGGLLAWARPATPQAEEAPPEAAVLPGAPALGTAPPLAPAPVAATPARAAPTPVPAATGAAAWNALPVQPRTNGVGPATQARSTADGLRKLTRRVPGASLPQQDDSLRRATPTTTNRNPLGLTGALAQYLSATANDSRAEKEQNSR